jgi:cell division protein FtsZ
VDEAATRIREEVDADANIILGATFDETLEGLIRVSVVATGIDRVEGEIEQRPSMMASRPAARPSATAQQPQASRPAPAHPAPAPATAAKDPVGETIVSVEAELERELEIANQIEMAATSQAAPSPAPAASTPDFQPQNRLFAGPSEATAQPAPQRPAMVPLSQAPASRPAPEAAPMLRSEPELTRMPRIEDFPPVVKAEMEHRDAPHGQSDERGPMGLLKRLSSSLGRREEDEAGMPATAAPAPQRRPLSAEASVYAPRRGQLDDQGRVTPQARPAHEDDQLEIPAFLRRQAK